ncbi:MAG: energy transducer TonB [Candidatus Omnitrophota bacterium]|nr:energy transducer TonB [Candidatus Omnitrophota bacterium]
MKGYGVVSVVISVAFHVLVIFFFSWLLASRPPQAKKREIIRDISELKVIPEAFDFKKEMIPQALRTGDDSAPPPFMSDMTTVLDFDFSQAFSLKNPTLMEERVSEVVVAYDNVDASLRKMPEYMHYYQAIRAKLDRAARKLYDGRDGGVVMVSFIVSSDGRLQSVSLEADSVKSQRLRTLALNTVYDAVPFPPFPEELKNRTNLPFTITINFKNN